MAGSRARTRIWSVVRPPPPWKRTRVSSPWPLRAKDPRVPFSSEMEMASASDRLRAGRSGSSTVAGGGEWTRLWAGCWPASGFWAISPARLSRMWFHSPSLMKHCCLQPAEAAISTASSRLFLSSAFGYPVGCYCARQWPGHPHDGPPPEGNCAAELKVCELYRPETGRSLANFFRAYRSFRGPGRRAAEKRSQGKGRGESGRGKPGGRGRRRDDFPCRPGAEAVK